MNTNKELIKWARHHKENIEARNMAIGGLFIIAEIIAIGGFFNYWLISQIVAFPIAVFFAEFGLLAPLLFLNFHLTIKVGFSKDTAEKMLVFAFVLAVAMGAAMALAAAFAFVLAQVVALAAAAALAADKK